MISIIIPVLNEESTIETTLTQLLNLQGDKEIIVVDGGSTDATAQIVSHFPCTFIQSIRQRATQMNDGADVAKGDILWFIHSDSQVDNLSLLEIDSAIRSGYDGGSFLLKFTDADSKSLSFIEKTSNLRSAYLRLIFGDQGIFIKKSLFEEVNKFKPIDIMEDWDFSIRIHKIAKIKKPILTIGTSARRFKQGGTWKTLLNMHRIKLLYLLGVSPTYLNKLYREVR